MRIRLLLVLALLNLPAAADIPPVRRALPHQLTVVDKNIALASKGKSRGAWYMSEEGHAVFCYGPTMYIQAGAGLRKVATFCRGDKVIVPLHD